MSIHAEELRRYLAESTGRPVSLKMNDNTHSMISARRDGTGPGLRVSLHRMFLDADEKVLKALARFIVSPTPTVRRVIREYINTNHERISQISVASAPRVIRGTARGRYYHLGERAQRLNQEHFDGALRFRIMWGKSIRAGRRQRHVTLGTWNDRQGIIRIHPMLDSPAVPGYFLDYIIYHEMTHIAVPASVCEAGRRHVHTPEFYAIERRYPLYDMAQAWEDRWLTKLISWWNGGQELPETANDFFG